MVEVHLQCRVACTLGGYGTGSVDVAGGMQTAGVVVIHVVGNAEEPCGEARRTAEGGHLEISLDEGLLGDVVAQGLVSQSLGEEKLPHP